MMLAVLVACLGLAGSAGAQDTVAFAKISGGLQDPDDPVGGRGQRQGLKAPTHAFEFAIVQEDGAVLVLDEEGNLVPGDLVVNYRTLGPLSCAFMPGAVAIADGTASLTSWTYECMDEDGIMTVGTADLTLVGRGPKPPGPKKGHTRDRGSICVSASDPAFDIPVDGGCDAGTASLDRGNIIVGEMLPDDGSGTPEIEIVGEGQ
jgi:hypothetical protein